MKILAIRGKNLGSLEAFDLALEDGPLAGAGLFAITGPTGSGKSTLLDAMCLALFDRIPRAEHSGVAIRQDGEADNWRPRSDDPRSILRTGTAEGYAEVDFVGRARHVFRARWSVRRARNRPDGTLQAQTVELTDLTSGERFAGRKTDVLEEIKRRLGLTFPQFRRSVLLAQYEFAAFLKAKVSERADLLERITQTEIYSDLSIAAHARAQEEKRELERLEGALQGALPLDADARAAQEELERQLRGLRDAARQALETARAQRDWHARRAELAAARDRAEQALAAAEAAREASSDRAAALAAVRRAQPHRAAVEQHDQLDLSLAEAAAARERSAAQADGAAAARGQAQTALAAAAQAADEAVRRLDAARPGLEKARVLDAQIADAETALARAAAEEDALAAAHGDARTSLGQLTADGEAAQAAAAELAAWFGARAPQGALVDQWERWEEAFARLEESLPAIDAARSETDAAQRALAELDEALGAASAGAAADEAAHAAAREEVAALSEAAAGAPLAALRDRRRGLQAREQLLSAALSHVALVASRCAAAANRRADIDRLREALAALGAQERERETELAAEQGALGEARAALALALTLSHRDVASLRGQLRDGEPCAVCGATSHPWSQAAPDFAALVGQQEARVAALDDRVGALTEALGRLRATLVLDRQRMAELEQGLPPLLREIEDARPAWAALRQQEELPEDLLEEGLAERLALRVESVRAALREVDGEELAAMARQQALDDARGRLNELRARQEARRQRRDAALEDRQRRLLDRQAAHNRLAALEAQRDAAEAALAGPLASWPDSARRLGRDTAALRAECGALVAEWRDRERRQSDLRARQAELSPRLAAARADLDARAHQLAVARARRSQCADALAALRAERLQLFDGEAAAAVESRLAAAAQAAAAAQRAAQARLTDAQRADDQARVAADLARQAHDRLTREALAARERLEAELAALELGEAELRALLARDAAWIEAEGGALQALAQAVEVARATLVERTCDLTAHERETPAVTEADAAERQHADADAACARTQDDWSAARAVLDRDDRMREQADALLADREAQRREWARWESLRELIGSADGQKFSAFAQSLTLDALVANANRHLEELFPRYRLQRVPGTDLELQVIDQDMGDDVRSVHSLSGGESFLVSLALAMGLASLSSRHTQVESLFIDEGFGSLDPDTLDIALTSLDALQSQGRKIGMISHMPALVERIGAQVRVERAGNGASRVRVRGQTVPRRDPAELAD